MLRQRCVPFREGDVRRVISDPFSKEFGDLIALDIFGDGNQYVVVSSSSSSFQHGAVYLINADNALISIDLDLQLMAGEWFRLSKFASSSTSRVEWLCLFSNEGRICILRVDSIDTKQLSTSVTALLHVIDTTIAAHTCTCFTCCRMKQNNHFIVAIGTHKSLILGHLDIEKGSLLALGSFNLGNKVCALDISSDNIIVVALADGTLRCYTILLESNEIFIVIINSECQGLPPALDIISVGLDSRESLTDGFGFVVECADGLIVECALLSRPTDRNAVNVVVEDVGCADLYWTVVDAVNVGCSLLWSSATEDRGRKMILSITIDGGILYISRERGLRQQQQDRILYECDLLHSQGIKAINVSACQRDSNLGLYIISSTGQLFEVRNFANRLESAQVPILPSADVGSQLLTDIISLLKKMNANSKHKGWNIPLLANLMEDSGRYFVKESDPVTIAQFTLASLLATPESLLSELALSDLLSESV